MSPGLAVACFLLAILALLGAAILLVVRSDARYQREMPTTRMQPVRHHPVRMLPPEWPCAAPRIPLTIPQAHTAMQRHRTCSLDSCPRKRHAHSVLVFAGRIVSQR